MEPRETTIKAGDCFTLEQILDMFGISQEDYDNAMENNNGVIPIGGNNEVQFIDLDE